MAHRVKLPNGTVGVFPDDMADSEIESVIQKQFPPTQAANESSIPETPFNGREPEPEEETGLTGVAVDAADMFSKALSGGMKFIEDAPENYRRIKADVGENGISGIGHILGQLHAEHANLLKAAVNTPHDFAKYMLRKNLAGNSAAPDMYALLRDRLGDKVKLPDAPRDFADVIPSIPEDTGVEKALGLEAQPERGDNLTRAIPLLAAMAEGGYSSVAGLNRWLKAPSKIAALAKPFEENISKAKEAHTGAEEAHAMAQEAHESTQAETAAEHNSLEKQFSAEHGKPIGTLTPTGQEVKINIKKAKKAENAEALAIPEKEVGEIPSEPSTKHLEEKVGAQIKASEDARKDLEKILGVKDHPTHKAGVKVKQAIQKVKDVASALYNAGRKHFVDKKVKADNDAAIKSTTDELNRLKDSDELAPGYGHGGEVQKGLESTLEALKGEEVAASDLFDLQQHATKIAKNFRSKAFSGVSELEKKHYLGIADRMKAHADNLAKRLESVGGEEVQKMFKEANQGWRTYHEAKENTVGRAARKGEVPSDALLKIAREETGNKFMQALVKSDADLKKHLLAAHVGPTSLKAFENPTSLVTKYMKELPEVEEKVRAFQRALSAVKETKTATKAEAAEIKSAHKELVDSMKAEAKLQADRQKAVKEHAQLDREIKSHEAAIPKLEARIKAEEITAGEVKRTKAEVSKAKANIAKAKEELAMHKKALAEKHPRKKALSKLFGAALRLAGISEIAHKVGL